MKKSTFSIVLFAMVFLLFIQMGGTLVSSIYTLDLLNTSLDAKALGLLFFFFPMIFYFFKKPIPRWLTWLFVGGLFLSRGFLASLDTNDRMLVSGIGTALSLSLFPFLLLRTGTAGKSRKQGLEASLGLVFAVLISVMLRTINSGIDYSLTLKGAWIGWLLGAILCVTLIELEVLGGESVVDINPSAGQNPGVTSSILGIFIVLTLVYFIFSAPGVLARWTEGNYIAIILFVSILSTIWFLSRMRYGQMFEQLSRRFIFGWNILFSISLLTTILFHQVVFPKNIVATPVIVGEPSFWQQVPLFAMILLSPVIYLDLEYFWGRLIRTNPSPRQMAPGMMLGSFTLVVLVFMNIFTNVWGYIEPVSPFFRNKFYLPFLIMTLILCLVVMIRKDDLGKQKLSQGQSFPWFWGFLLVVILLLIANSLIIKPMQVANDNSGNSLKVMTYNIQQGNDIAGEQSFIRQLLLIQQEAPDILVLQECDSARVSLNNIDLVRYFADNLGYYSYYGPKTISGSYGTSIISRYPIRNSQTIFTFSDQDENATAYAQVVAMGRVFNIYNVHPDGSDDAKSALTKMLLDRTSGQKNVIIMGDFNLRDDDDGYKIIDAVFTNSWIDTYPTGISSSGIDMSGRNRIDHIFISSDLSVRSPVYLLPPDSATDHPVHWAEIYWEN